LRLSLVRGIDRKVDRGGGKVVLCPGEKEFKKEGKTKEKKDH
jgi:hypothetical protein